MNTTKPNTTTDPRFQKRSRAWLIIVGLFALQIAAWTVWLVIASHHRVAEVPLTTQGSR